MRIPGRRQLRNIVQTTEHIHGLHRSAGPLPQVHAAIRARMETRADAFLDTMERAVFAHPASPYRPLLSRAGYDLARVTGLVRRQGVEECLRALCRDGVYVAIEEFKGTAEARRGSDTFRFRPEDFDNPLAGGGLAASSGGTRSSGIRSQISLADHRVGLEHLVAALDAYGLLERPMAVWLAQGHGANLWAVTGLSVASRAPAQSFTLERVHMRHAAFHEALRLSLRRLGVRLSRLTYIPYGREDIILDWAARPEARGGCGIFTMPSLAIRLVSAAGGRRNLENVTFLTIGEPLTPTKYARIQDAGARAFSSLGFTEFGRATYGCARPAAADDGHLVRDTVAVIQRRRPADALGTEVDALAFTALWPHARKILLNVETGDYATLTTRRCGCPLEALGWTEHLHEIRSFEKLKIDGRLFSGPQLYGLIEDTLPARFGGEPADYQLLEEEGPDGHTSVSVLVHPRLGSVDEQAVLDVLHAALETISAGGRGMARGTIRVRRAAPVLTKVGKFMPVRYLTRQAS